MAFFRKVQAKIKTCSKEVIKNSCKMCTKCGNLLTSEACPNCACKSKSN